MKIKKNDIVKILSGKDKGKTGKVLRTFSTKNRLSVEGINSYKKHVRPKREGESGEIVEIFRSINASNVALLCPSCNKPTKIGYRQDGKTKARFCRKCEVSI